MCDMFSAVFLLINFSMILVSLCVWRGRYYIAAYFAFSHFPLFISPSSAVVAASAELPWIFFFNFIKIMEMNEISAASHAVQFRPIPHHSAFPPFPIYPAHLLSKEFIENCSSCKIVFHFVPCRCPRPLFPVACLVALLHGTHLASGKFNNPFRILRWCEINRCASKIPGRSSKMELQREPTGMHKSNSFAWPRNQGWAAGNAIHWKDTPMEVTPLPPPLQHTGKINLKQSKYSYLI